MFPIHCLDNDRQDQSRKKLMQCIEINRKRLKLHRNQMVHLYEKFPSVTLQSVLPVSVGVPASKTSLAHPVMLMLESAAEDSSNTLEVFLGISSQSCRCIIGIFSY